MYILEDWACSDSFAAFSSFHAVIYSENTECSNCGELKLSHQICLACGFYSKREVILSEDISISEDYDLSVIRPIQNVSNHLFVYENNYFINTDYSIQSER